MNTVPNISISPANNTNYRWEETLENKGTRSAAENTPKTVREFKLQDLAVHLAEDMRNTIFHMNPEQLVSMTEEMDESEMN